MCSAAHRWSLRTSPTRAVTCRAKTSIGGRSYGAAQSIGANATVVCGNTIGRYAFIGAGAVVTRDIPDFALIVGIPVASSAGCASAASNSTFARRAER